MHTDTHSYIAAAQAGAKPRNPDEIVAELQRDVAVDPTRFLRCPRRTCRRQRQCKFDSLPCAAAVLSPERRAAAMQELQASLDHANRTHREAEDKKVAWVRYVMSRARSGCNPCSRRRQPLPPLISFSRAACAHSLVTRK